MHLISCNAAESHFEAWFPQCAFRNRNRFGVCTLAFPPLSASGWVRPRLPPRRPAAGVARPSLHAAALCISGSTHSGSSRPGAGSPRVLSAPEVQPCPWHLLPEAACFPVARSRVLSAAAPSGLSATREKEAARTNYKHTLPSVHTARLRLIVRNELFLQKDLSLTRSSLPQPGRGKVLD